MNMMTKRIPALAIGISCMCLASFAQVPVYLAKALKPTEQNNYERSRHGHIRQCGG
jgi:hypothetical protein